MNWTDSSQKKKYKWLINTWRSVQHPLSCRKHNSKLHEDSISLQSD
jgi:hypothetical protein